VLGVQLNDTLWDTGATPVPDKVSLNGVSSALLVKAILPLALPVVAGVNVTLKVAFCPTVKVSGSDGPLMLNPVPDTVAREIVVLDVPLPVSVTVWVLLLPTVTLPKVTLEGATPSTGRAHVPPMALLSTACANAALHCPKGAVQGGVVVRTPGTRSVANWTSRMFTVPSSLRSQALYEAASLKEAVVLV